MLEYGTKLNLVTLISSVRDYDKMELIFKTYRPELVFHAAAHKHVPLMETVPEEAVKITSSAHSMLQPLQKSTRQRSLL